MMYQSTRDKENQVTSAQAILTGLAGDGGLFVPQALPSLSMDDLSSLLDKGYPERAEAILARFLTDFPEQKLNECVRAAYTAEKFGGEGITGLSCLYPGAYLLELWHGPTCAFKDMALQLLPHLLTASASLTGCKEELVILVATSGDTGKAALDGFRDVPGTRIVVFYPEHGVSAMQKRQMTTQEGENVAVCAIQGNFDDAQTAVKSIFSDAALRENMQKAGKRFSSANSINWGRLVPQIVYYVSAYLDLVKNGEIQLGDEVNVCVPTGNFGNILAAYYAKQMGLPFHTLICASNRNRVLTDFIRTGVYDKNRDFYATISPSMDILISSNLERLLFALSGEDDGQVREWYSSLAQTGRFAVSGEVKEKLQAEFYGGFCTDEETKAEIQAVFDTYSYLCDPHTAVAVKVYGDYRKETGDERRTIIASTANPYKFAPSVLSAVEAGAAGDEYEQVQRLFEISGMEVPVPLATLKDKPVRFEGSIPREGIRQEVVGMLGLAE